MGALNAHRLLSHQRAEFNECLGYFYAQLAHKHWLTQYKDRSMSKSSVLDLAQKVGLSVPAFLITTSKAEVQAFQTLHGRIITKNLSEVQFYTTEDEFGKLLTIEPVFDTMPDTFFVSLFQQYIEKEFEIRTYYLDRKFYSMAIFSQNNDKTAVDFRNYDSEKPNRSVPYQLPVDIEYKLQQVIDQLGLNNCSIDIIKAASGGYCFLEINPVGQFGMTSGPCNYYLERAVAQYLIKQDQYYGS